MGHSYPVPHSFDTLVEQTKNEPNGLWGVQFFTCPGVGVQCLPFLLKRRGFSEKHAQNSLSWWWRRDTEYQPEEWIRSKQAAHEAGDDPFLLNINIWVIDDQHLVDCSYSWKAHLLTMLFTDSFSVKVFNHWWQASGFHKENATCLSIGERDNCLSHLLAPTKANLVRGGGVEADLFACKQQSRQSENCQYHEDRTPQ